MKKAVIVVLSVALLGSLAANYLLYRRYSSARPLVRVGNTFISRREYEDQLDARYGQPVLLDMVYTALIRNAATKANIYPTESDISAREDLIRKDSRVAGFSGVTPEMLDDAETDAYAKNDLHDRIATVIAFERLRSRSLSATDAELRAFYESNKLSFYVKQPTKTTMVYVSNDPDGVRAGQVEELLEWGRSGETLSRQGYIVSGVKGMTLSSNLPAALKTEIDQAIASSAPGDVKVIGLGKDKSNSLLIRLDSKATEGIPPYEQIKPLVALAYKQQKGTPSMAELAHLYGNDKVVVEVSKYRQFFSEIEVAAERLKPHAKSSTTADALPAKP